MVTESEFQDAVIELANWSQWFVHHDRPARTKEGWRTAIIGDPGYPDLHIVRAPRSVFAELKTDSGALTEAQEVWLLALAACGHEVYLWRPDDLESIAEILNPAQRERPRNPVGMIGQTELL